MGRYRSYFSYVYRHKLFVFQECCRLGIPFRGFFHDMEKLSPWEFVAYARHFYERDGSPRFDTLDAYHIEAADNDQIDFLRHYRHHVINNSHHWQYWVITDNHSNHHILNMPLSIRKEMLADWLGVEKALKSGSTLEWYKNNRDRLVLDADTREWIEKQLGYSVSDKDNI